MRHCHGAPRDAEAFALGTTLYVPAVRADFMRKILRGECSCAPSVTLCLEDSIREDEIPPALENIRWFLEERRKLGGGPRILIRPRHPEMAAELPAAWLEDVSGLVLPKFSEESLPAWEEAVGGAGVAILPTLETADVLDASAMAELAKALDAPGRRERIPLLRVGGNDLQQALGVRRDGRRTLYDGPLGHALKMLACVFLPRGFALSAPVFEILDDDALLERELELDLAHGFCGKTAIHPAQAAVIARAFRVTPGDRDAAAAILGARDAVFRLDGRMCEPATHRRWAEKTAARALVYGVSEDLDVSA